MYQFLPWRDFLFYCHTITVSNFPLIASTMSSLPYPSRWSLLSGPSLTIPMTVWPVPWPELWPLGPWSYKEVGHHSLWSFPQPFFFFVCFTSYFMFSIAVLPHSPGVVYYHLLLTRETRIPGVAPFSFQIGIWDLFVHRRQKSYTPTAFGKLWTTPGVRCMKQGSS